MPTSFDPATTERDYLHGTSASAAVAVVVEGFRLLDTDLRPWGRGMLGDGIYVTRALDEAAGFATLQEDWACVLRVAMRPGTRIAWMNGTDTADLETLRREFGHEILGTGFAKAIPPNKHLQPRELFALIRHLHRTGNLDDALRDVRHWLRRLGYHGFGHPANDWGVVMFDPGRLAIGGLLLPDRSGRWQPAEPSTVAALAEREIDARLTTLEIDPGMAKYFRADKQELERRRAMLDTLRRAPRR